MAVKRSDTAEADIRRYAAYLIRVRSRQTAELFLIRLEETANRLAAMPGMGSPIDSTRPEISRLRTFGVAKHPTVQLVYRTTDRGGIEIVRVIHGARDILAILERTIPESPSS